LSTVDHATIGALGTQAFDLGSERLASTGEDVAVEKPGIEKFPTITCTPPTWSMSTIEYLP